MAAGKRLFGTDGIRGPFGVPPLVRETVTGIGFRLAETLERRTGRPAGIVVGGDTRESTPTIASWLLAGFAAAGGDGRYAGVLPTPAVAFLARHLGLDGAVAVSASHNPFGDNGIKFFDADGFKWNRGAESEIEIALAEPIPVPMPSPQSLPHADESLVDAYLDHLVATLPPDAPLGGLRLGIDAANGAAAPYVRRLFSDLGAEVLVIGDRPTGKNINLGYGSTHPARLMDLVRSERLSLGVALDGDADRALLVDETGVLQDGDTMLYLWALELAGRGLLEPRSIVATVMSNLGLELGLRDQGIETIRCDVGDRVVVETMREHGSLLGGEQSGHLVHLDLGTTGDGLSTALHMSRLLARADRPLSRLAAQLGRLPQVLLNVPVSRKIDFDELPGVASKVAEVEGELGDRGRLLLRYSGTEPLARVMIEGTDQARIELLARMLADEIGTVLGDPR
jgi:phosphoglucosamine mutase